MQKPSARQRRLMEKATANYQGSLMKGISYLSGRGLVSESLIAQARLGVVDSPEPGHEIFAHRLTIPYMDMLGVCGMKFRCMQHPDCKDVGCTKYLALEGCEIGLYNVVATDSVNTTIHVTEGELDCLVLRQTFPDDAVVAVPGVNLWKPHHPSHFSGFDKVLLWMDGDKAGKDLGNRIRKDVRAAEVVPIPTGMDVTDLLLAKGPEALRELAGLEDDE